MPAMGQENTLPFSLVIVDGVIDNACFSNKPKRGRKRKLDEDAVKSAEPDGEVPGPSTQVNVAGSVSASSNPEEGNLNNFRGYFREIHCHTFKLLRMDLKLNPTKVFKKTKLSDAMINEEAWYYKATEKVICFLIINY